MSQDHKTLFIQIPCLNEEDSLPITAKELPRTLEAFPTLQIKWLLIDDGSTDKTIDVANKLGFDYVVKHATNKGLAEAWKTGLAACLSYGADFIVNVDADNQYSLNDLPALLKPVIEGNADMSIGSRSFFDIPYFSRIKCYLQIIGSKAVSFLAGTKVLDATSGYRAFNRKAASSFNVFTKYTYTLETILQSGYLNLDIANVPVGNNNQLRESRLLKSSSSYIKKSALTLSQVFLLYNPLKTFSLAASLFLIPALFIALRFLYYFLVYGGEGKIQSLILFAVLTIIGFQTLAMGLLAHLIAINRRLLEEQRSHHRSTHQSN